MKPNSLFEDKAFYDEVMSHKYFYTLMYCPNRVNFRSLWDQIIKVLISDIRWSKDKNTFFWVWSGPGPDYNIYTQDTYGKGWAFTIDEIMEAWNEQIH